MQQAVSILATGDEILNGQITNSNGQAIAQTLWRMGIDPGMQLVVDDNETNMQCAMRFLIDNHQVMLTIGGLGPTSDDRTRYALASILDLPLQEHTPSWQALVERLDALQIPVSESNRQQTLFPKGAEVLPNPHGTAPGCYIQHGEQHVFMLPGPPNECLPMFKSQVLPKLEAIGLVQKRYRQSWFILGALEAMLGQQIESLGLPDSVVVGYRFDFPYIELKLNATNQKDLDAAITKVLPLISEKIISENNQRASQILGQQLKAKTQTIACDNQAIQTYLRQYIASEQWATMEESTLKICKQKGEAEQTSEWQFAVESSTGTVQLRFTVPFRRLPERTVMFAAEIMASQVLHNNLF